MHILYPNTLITDLVSTLDERLARDGIVNIPQLAEEIRRRNESANIALEDIAAELMRHAQARNVAMLFDGHVDGVHG